MLLNIAAEEALEVKQSKYSLIFICFDSIKIFEEIALLSFQVSWTYQFWIKVKKFLDYRTFPLVFQILVEALGVLSRGAQGARVACMNFFM